MITLTEVVAGLTAALKSVDGLNATAYVPGQANFPAAFPVLLRFEMDNLADTTYMAVFEVPILVGSAVAENQLQLLPLVDPLSAGSVAQAIRADRTLGGLAVDARVVEAPRRMTFDEVAAYKAWGQILTVQVYV